MFQVFCQKLRHLSNMFFWHVLATKWGLTFVMAHYEYLWTYESCFVQKWRGNLLVCFDQQIIKTTWFVGWRLKTSSVDHFEIENCVSVHHSAMTLQLHQTESLLSLELSTLLLSLSCSERAVQRSTVTHNIWGISIHRSFKEKKHRQVAIAGVNITQALHAI